MQYKGHSVYDDDAFFERYLKKRNRSESPNNLLEAPIIDELIGAVKGKAILDLGCGEARLAPQLLAEGAESYHGIDGSARMVAAAKEQLPAGPWRIEQAALEDFAFSEQQYDLVISRLVFHYIENLQVLFEQIHRSLRAGGQLIFSVEHPIITSCYDAYAPNAKRQHWIVDNYFEEGSRINTWLDKDVVKYHRTLEAYFQLFQSTGLRFLELRESKPIAALFDDPVQLERRKRIPLFILFKLSK